MSALSPVPVAQKPVTLFVRSLLKSIPAGSRWVTVHPNGPDAKGQPILVQETKQGSGVFHVIGGAGGKLNFLKLRGIKPKSSYKQDALDRAKTRRTARAEQRKQDKESGVYESKKAAVEKIKTQTGTEISKFIDTVAKVEGWKPEDMAFPEETYANVSEKAYERAVKEHRNKLLKRAHEAVEVNRRQLLVDADARAQAGLGEIPVETTDADVLSAQDIDPVSSPAGLGYSTNYGERSGLDDEELADEAGEVKARAQAERGDDGDAGQKAKASAEAIRKELEAVRSETPTLSADLVDARKAVDLLKAEKALKNIQRQAREATRKIETSPEEPKAYVLEVGQPDDQDIAEDIANDLRTIQTRAFLGEALKGGATAEAMGRHIGVGAYNAINSVSLTGAGAGLVGRDAVDVLGIAGTSQVLARRLRTDLTEDEASELLTALEDFHLNHYMDATSEALTDAKHWQEIAESIDLGNAKDGFDLARAKEMNAKRRDAINEASRILGTTLGEMEANAAMILALREKARDSVQVSLGHVSAEDAVRRARAIGLERGDYLIETVGANHFLTVHATGLDRLAAPINRADLEATRTSLDIINGHQDEDNWLPKGIANRPDLAIQAKPGAAPTLAQPFSPGPVLEQSIADYIGGRTADGDPPADIVADLLSSSVIDKVGDRRGEYFEALDKLAPMRDAGGKQIRAETHSTAFESLADRYVAGNYGADRTPLHRQNVEVNQTSVDALHRALADEPAGVLAYKPVGELERTDQGDLRKYFYLNVARDEGSQGLRDELADLESKEPEREVDDMFGRSTNPAWTEWKQSRDDKAADLHGKSLDWSKYVKIMGGQEHAYAAVQDLVRSSIERSFHQHYNTLEPDNPLKLGRSVIRGNLNHLDAVDSEARDRRMAEQSALVDSLRNRTAGRYAGGSVSDKIGAARERQEALEQSQMGMFSAEDDVKDSPLDADQRHTLGHAMERRIAAMMPRVGENFRPGKPTRLWQASMNGRFINQQRSVKLIEKNKRLILAQGVGSGKTVIGLSAFTHLHAQGKVKRGIFAVPSIVQGQFSGEALRYLEPGKYKWAIDPGASREQRIASYKDPDTHFAVVTHQALRDDLLYLGANQAGMTPEQMAMRLDTMDSAGRREWMKGMLEAEGIDYGYMMVDEGHDLLNRRGKKNSRMSNVLDALSGNSEYYVSASADPVKNDPSEIYSSLAKMDPERYHDQDRFMRRYGVDTPAAAEELRREMARYIYPGKIDPGVQVDSKVIDVPLSGGQKTSLKTIDSAYAAARAARIRGTVDLEATRELAPHAFDGVQNEDEVARALQDNLGTLHHTAVRRALNEGEHNAKFDKVSQIADARRGKPGVIFAHSLKAVHHVAERLRKEGHRVVVLTGADSSQEKERKKLAFRPEKGEAEADIIIASDAGSVGANLQRGQWLVQLDTPMTAKAQPLDAKILTPVGWVCMGDLQIGDEVIAGDGTPTQVLGVFPQGMKDVFKVTMTSGATTETCSDHLWFTRMVHERKNGSKGSVRTLDRIIDTLLVNDGSRDRANHHIPLVGAVSMKEKSVLIDPYTMGVLLGDGGLYEKQIILTSADQQIVDFVRAAVEKTGGELKKIRGKYEYQLVGDKVKYGYPATSNNYILSSIRRLKLAGVKSYGKFVPPEYLVNDIKTRLSVLQGLMDTDGTIDKRTGSLTFSTTSKRLVQDVTFLARSLGGVATASKGSITTYTHNGERRNGRVSYKVTIALPDDLAPFRLTRKMLYRRKRTRRYMGYQSIVSVEPSGKKECQCIQVAHPDHLYVTDDFIVTHNTHQQRRGRIHRLGQKNNVELMDLVGDHPVERSDRKRLKEKQALREVLTSPMEGLDDTGLAGYLNRARAEKGQDYAEVA